MSGENISSISPYSPKKIKGTGSSANQQVQKKPQDFKVSPKDSLELDSSYDVAVSREEVLHYLKLLKEEVSEVDFEVVERARAALSKGEYGKEVLEETVRNLAEDV